MNETDTACKLEESLSFLRVHALLIVHSQLAHH